MEYSGFPLPVGQDRQMDQAGGNSHRIRLPHQGADPLIIPEDIIRFQLPAVCAASGTTRGLDLNLPSGHIPLKLCGVGLP